MLGGADNPNGELPSYITGADNVAVLLFLLRRLTRRGINAACGQCPASGGHGTGAFTAPGWRR